MDKAVVNTAWTKLTAVMPARDILRSVTFPIYHGLAIIAVNRSKTEFVCVFQNAAVNGHNFQLAREPSFDTLMPLLRFRIPQRVMEMFNER